MSTFSETLRQERVRLGLTQSDFAALAGLTKKTQMLYELGKRVPDANYLMAIHKANADAYFILTGHRHTDFVL
jgi:transcriptional regulator with XRE-family HTH domain